MRHFLLNDRDQENLLDAIRQLDKKIHEVFMEREISTEFLDEEIVAAKARGRRDRKEQWENELRLKRFLDERQKKNKINSDEDVF
jgi:hypothetical protein